MTTVTYTVPAISCGHCTHTIETEVSDLQGVQSVKAEIDSKKVTITFDAPANEQAIKPCSQRSIILLKDCSLYSVFGHAAFRRDLVIGS